MASETGSRGPYAKTARVRADIVAAATAVFAETGYRAGSLREIAARAGLTDRAISHHFRTKEDLLHAVLRARDEAGGALIDNGPNDALDRILQLAHTDRARPGLIELHAVISAEAANPTHPAHTHYAQRYADFRAYLAGAFADIAAEQESPDAASPLTPEESAILLVALWEGLQLLWLYDREGIDVERLLRAYVGAAGAPMR